MTSRGVFITGTDTGAGKSVLAAAIAAALRASGRRVAALKPVMTGLDEVEEPGPGGSAWPPDHVLLGTAAGMAPEEVAPLRFGPAVSPHLAAELDGRPIDPAKLLGTLEAACDGADDVVVEGVGGLLVPLAPGYAVRDLARDLGLPVVIAARTGLGTLNHTLLTLEAARLAGLDVRAVVLTPWPEAPTAIELSNRHTIATLGGGIETATLPELAGPDLDALVAAGGTLPLERWLG